MTASIKDNKGTITSTTRDTACLIAKVLEGDRSNIALYSSSKMGDNKCNGRRSPRSSVSFGQVQVRQYVRVLGDHPACCDCLPLGLSWERSGDDTVFDVEEYHKVKASPEDCTRGQEQERKYEKRIILSQSAGANFCETIKNCANSQEIGCLNKDAEPQPLVSHYGANCQERAVCENKQEPFFRVRSSLSEEDTCARARRLTFEERKQLLMQQGEALDSSTHSAIQRAGNRQRRRNAMQAAITAAAKQQERETTAICKEPTKTRG
jgi:hypothetical protein